MRARILSPFKSCTEEKSQSAPTFLPPTVGRLSALVKLMSEMLPSKSIPTDLRTLTREARTAKF